MTSMPSEEDLTAISDRDAAGLAAPLVDFMDQFERLPDVADRRRRWTPRSLRSGGSSRWAAGRARQRVSSPYRWQKQSPRSPPSAPVLVEHTPGVLYPRLQVQGRHHRSKVRR